MLARILIYFYLKFIFHRVLTKQFLLQLLCIIAFYCQVDFNISYDQHFLFMLKVVIFAVLFIIQLF